MSPMLVSSRTVGSGAAARAGDAAFRPKPAVSNEKHTASTMRRNVVPEKILRISTPWFFCWGICARSAGVRHG